MKCRCGYCPWQTDDYKERKRQRLEAKKAEMRRYEEKAEEQ